MNRIYKIALSFGAFFLLSHVLTNIFFDRQWHWSSLVVAFFFGTITGLIYGVVMKKTMKGIGKTVVIDLPPNETRLREDGTTYIKGKAGFPGRLVLTEKQLIFKSKKIDNSDFEERIDRLSIKPFKERNFWMGTVNDLKITTTDDRTFHFVVYAPEEWIADLSTLSTERV